MRAVVATVPMHIAERQITMVEDRERGEGAKFYNPLSDETGARGEKKTDGAERVVFNVISRCKYNFVSII